MYILIAVLGILLTSLCLVLHFMAIRSLWKEKLERTKQRAILLNVNVCETILLLTFIPYWISIFLDVEHYRFVTASMALNHASAVSVTLMLIILTADRFIACYSPLKYRTYVTEFRVRMALFTSWIIGGSSFLVSGFIRLYGGPKIISHRTYENAILLGFYISSFLCCFVTYAYMYAALFSIKKRQKSRRNRCMSYSIQYHCSSGSVHIRLKRKFMMLTCNNTLNGIQRLAHLGVFVTLTFVVFSLVPAITAGFINYHDAFRKDVSFQRQLLNCTWEISFFTAPLVYVFGAKWPKAVLRLCNCR